MAEATDTIIVAGVVVTGSTLLRDVRQNKPKAAPLIFGFFMVAGLLLIAIPAPKVAKGLAYLSLVGAFVVNGPTIFGLASSITGGANSTTSAPSAPLGTLPGQQGQKVAPT